MSTPTMLAAHSRIDEPKLLFHGMKEDTHPLRGLSAHGPYSLAYSYPAMVRIACVAPKGKLEPLNKLIGELNASHTPKDAPNYYIDYAGFEKIFRVPIRSGGDEVCRELPVECATKASAKDGLGLVQLIHHTIAQLSALRSSFDVVLLYLPREWEACFE